MSQGQPQPKVCGGRLSFSSAGSLAQLPGVFLARNSQIWSNAYFSESITLPVMVGNQNTSNGTIPRLPQNSF